MEGRGTFQDGKTWLNSKICTAWNGAKYCFDFVYTLVIQMYGIIQNGLQRLANHSSAGQGAVIIIIITVVLLGSALIVELIYRGTFQDGITWLNRNIRTAWNGAKRCFDLVYTLVIQLYGIIQNGLQRLANHSSAGQRAVNIITIMIALLGSVLFVELIYHARPYYYCEVEKVIRMLCLLLIIHIFICIWQRFPIFGKVLLWIYESVCWLVRWLVRLLVWLVALHAAEKIAKPLVNMVLYMLYMALIFIGKVLWWSFNVVCKVLWWSIDVVGETVWLVQRLLIHALKTIAFRVFGVSTINWNLVAGLCVGVYLAGMLLVYLAGSLLEAENPRRRRRTDVAGTDEIPDSLLCLICSEKQKNITFQCGHMNTCEECAMKITECPLCRAVITSRITTYY